MRGSGLFGRRREAGTVQGPGAAGVEGRTQQIGRELLEEGRRHSASAISKRFWSERLMRWAMEEQSFRTQLFRFVDVFPVLRTPAAVFRAV